MAHLLVTDGGTGAARSSLGAVRLLGQRGHTVDVTESGTGSLAAASRWSRRTHRVPAVHADPDAYAAAVRSIEADLVIACSDPALVALGDPATRFLDKATLAGRAASAGLKTPETLVFDDEQAMVDAADDLPYPVVVKPAVSAVPARRADHPAQLVRTGAAGAWLVQPYLSGPMVALGGVCDGERLVGIVQQRYLRTWPVDCGTSSAAITVETDAYFEAGLGALLRGHRGVFQAQFRDEHLLDLNVRPYGSIALAAAAGVDLLELHVAVHLGLPLPDAIQRGRPGHRYRWTEGDLRHAWNELRGGRPGVVAALLPRSGTVHGVWSWRDPKPALARARMVARRRTKNRRVT